MTKKYLSKPNDEKKLNGYEFSQILLTKKFDFYTLKKLILPDNFYDYEIPDGDLGKLAMKTRN